VPGFLETELTETAAAAAVNAGWASVYRNKDDI
jgi:hypothetical protein